MKKHLLYFIIPGLLVAAGCNKSVSNRTSNAPALNPSASDANAGSWKPVLLSRPDTFVVATPAAPGTPLFAADLFEIKALQQKMTGDQAASIKYWAAGNVLRWNETMRELVAKYNLPPYQNTDSTYPIPNANNPLAYPLFPFSNPPYAARAYAYVSAAQYDALVACWYYKAQFNQKSPYNADSSVQAKGVTKTDLPGYPSEAAVVAAVTAEMMKLLFPGEIASVNAKAQDAEWAAIASGSATRAAVTAGDALGRQVAELFIARARGDNAGKAVGTPAVWSQFETNIIGLGQIPWYSQETPRRPPMLPLFSKVKGFLVDSATILSLRPGPPPNTGSDQMKSDCDEVYTYIKNPTQDNQKIVQFWADGAGTYTPPGHWNTIAAEDFIKQNYSEVRWARNLALLNMAEMDAAISCWDIKYFYFNPRPTQMVPLIKTLTGIPNFPSYVSGHSMFSGAASTVLSYLIPGNADKYEAMAQQAAMSRLLGGIHYRTDCETGLTVGKNIGGYAVARGQTDGAN